MKTARLLVPTALCVLAVALMAGGTANAQTGAASLTGLVTDQSGAAVPGATVTATNQATNVTYPAVANAVGNYTITSLPVGTYVVKAELASFKTGVTKPIQLEAMQVVRLDFKLELGAIEETVVVSSETQVLQTETATVGEVISGSTLAALPLNGRNTGQLSLLLPGVVTPNPSAFTEIRNFSSGRPYVNGNREQTNNYMIDGVDMNESIDNLVAYQPSPDALAEISVETNNYAADTGNVAGAVISNVIKSGTNSFHGNVFEFYRNSKMDANSWANNRSSAAKPERRQDIFGGTFGGPLIKNTLFFFGDYQGTRFDAPGRSWCRWRRRPGATAICRVSPRVKDPQTGQLFAGNQIPADRISPTARAILNDTSLYPLPNRSVGGVLNNYVGNTLRTIDADQADVRIDWSVSEKDKVFGRYSFAEYEIAPGPTRLPAAARQPDDGAVQEPRVQLEPHLQVVARQRGARRLQPDHDRLRHARLGRHRRRQRDVRHRRRPADSRLELPRNGQRPHQPRCYRHRHGHARQDLPDQREGHVDQGAARAEVRRPVPALRPGALLRREQRPARPLHLRRRLHQRAVCRLPARPGGDKGRGSSTRRRGRTCTTASRSTCRTTSRSRRP